MALFAKAFVQGAAPPVLPVSRLSSKPGRPLHEALDRGVPSAVAVAATVLVAGVTTKRRSPITRSAVAMRATAKKKKPTTKKLISPQRRVQRLFVEEFKKTMFSPNPWYECPEETFPGGTKRIYDWWMTTRPTRDIEKICDGRDGCGCTWKQMDGRRGVSYVTFNEDGQVVYVREVGEPQGVGKFKDNTMKSLQPVMGVMNVITGALNFAEWYLKVEDFKEPAQPLNGLEAPRSRRAVDVVKYLWEEAQWDQVDPVGRIMAEFSEDCVYEDLSREQEAFVGFEEVKRYQQETKDSTPDNLRFFLDEVTDGDKACTVLWHVEFNSRMSPRGVSYYELNEEGKVCYVRSAYDINF